MPIPDHVQVYRVKSQFPYLDEGGLPKIDWDPMVGEARHIGKKRLAIHVKFRIAVDNCVADRAGS